MKNKTEKNKTKSSNASKLLRIAKTYEQKQILKSLAKQNKIIFITN